MPRVLHLLGQTPDFQAEQVAAALVREGGGAFSIATRRIGAGGEYRNLPMAVFGLRRAIGRAFDVVHAWDGAALAVASLASRRPVLYTPPGFPARSSSIWRETLLARRDVHYACSTAAQQRAYVRAGVPIDRCHLIPPSVTINPSLRRPDLALRAALDFRADDFVLLAPGESTRAAGHREALWTTSILHVLDERYRLLVWGRGPQVDALERLAAKLRQPRLLTVAERTLGRADFADVLWAADLAIVTPTATVPPLATWMCAAAGLPILGVEDCPSGEPLAGVPGVVRVPKRSPRLLAQRVIELRGDPALTAPSRSGSILDAMHSPVRFAANYFELYRQLARR